MKLKKKTKQTVETFRPLPHTTFVPVKEASYFHVIQIHKRLEIATLRLAHDQFQNYTLCSVNMLGIL